MKFLNKTIVIQNTQSKEHIVALLQKQTESWHKDGSVAMFEGVVGNAGNFSITFEPQYKPVKMGRAGAMFTMQGSVREGVTQNTSVTEITFSIKKSTLYLQAIMVLFWVACACVYSAKLNAKPILWFGVLFFALIGCVVNYITFKTRLLNQ